MKTKYTLILPVEVIEEIRTIAAQKNTTMLEVLRQYIRLGLLIEKVDKVVVTIDGQEKEIIRL